MNLLTYWEKLYIYKDFAFFVGWYDTSTPYLTKNCYLYIITMLSRPSNIHHGCNIDTCYNRDKFLFKIFIIQKIYKVHNSYHSTR